jgi:hypothetical protein
MLSYQQLDSIREWAKRHNMPHPTPEQTVRTRQLLQLPKNEPGKLIPHELDNHKRDTLAWLACLELWKFLGSTA